MEAGRLAAVQSAVYRRSLNPEAFPCLVLLIIYYYILSVLAKMVSCRRRPLLKTLLGCGVLLVGHSLLFSVVSTRRVSQRPHLRVSESGQHVFQRGKRDGSPVFFVRGMFLFFCPGPAMEGAHVCCATRYPIPRAGEAPAVRTCHTRTADILLKS